MNTYLLILPVLVCLCTASLKGYVYGFKRLYQPSTKTTVDLVYDVHVKEKISFDEMTRSSYSEVKKKLYPSEVRVLEALEHLNTYADPHSIAVIWESSTQRPWKSPYFVNYSDRLIAQRLSKLSFSHADNCRRAVESACISEGKSLGRNPNTSCNGCSFNNPYPLNPGLIRTIQKQAGMQVWRSYNQLYTHRIRQIQQYGVDTFCEYRRSHPDTFEAWSRLVDIELLSHVLASPKKRIIVYSGGAHVGAVADFLQGKAGYQVIYNHNTGPIGSKGTDVEIDLRVLDIIDSQPIKLHLPHGSFIQGLLSGVSSIAHSVAQTVSRGASAVLPVHILHRPRASKHQKYCPYQAYPQLKY